ncbi:MAG: hypothetical protein C0503_00670 [Gemmatimonas sp.]|nr:hypothetical protein [Gemmatimonas sp.]
MTEMTAEKPDKLEKALRKLEESRGLLEPADRYKALVNAVKQAQDLIEMGDRKARFALVIMSVLNAVAVLLVARGGTSLMPTTGLWSLALVAQIAVYVVVTLYFVAQAVSALRPRGVHPPPAHEMPSQVEPGRSMRVLFHADVMARGREDYRALWERLRMDNLTTELADQLYTLSMVNQRKYAALDRLYFGVNLMTALLGLMLGTLGLYHLMT